MNHRGNNRRPDDPVRIWENQTAWRTVSKAVRQRNPICQAIENGEHCHCWSTQVHHIIAPEDAPELRIDWSNLVALCNRHHVPGKGDSGLFQYMPTTGFNNEVFLHNDIVVGAHASRRTKRNGGLQPTGTPGAKLFVSSSLPQAVLDKALGSPEELAELLGA
jgi:hypothetical protein